MIILKAILAAFLAAQMGAPMWAQAAGVSHASAPVEPQNLGQLKTRLKAYHDCTGSGGCYAKSLDAQSLVALHFLEWGVAHAKPGEKLVLVLDIDETSLSNYPEMVDDNFGYIPRDWNAWTDEAKAPAIPGVLRLYQRARQLGVSVFFITGRPDTQRAVTEKNLYAAGYSDWAGLVLRSKDQLHEATVPFKSAARAEIARQGYRIILSVGDQWSDLRGMPQAEFNVKLPNPFYIIP